MDGAALNMAERARQQVIVSPANNKHGPMLLLATFGTFFGSMALGIRFGSRMPADRSGAGGASLGFKALSRATWIVVGSGAITTTLLCSYLRVSSIAEFHHRIKEYFPNRHFPLRDDDREQKELLEAFRLASDLDTSST